MGRPSKSEKRDCQLNVKLTFREIAWVARRAKALGMRPVDYARVQLFADRPLPARRLAVQGHLDPLFLVQLSRLGNNLNQVTRRLHQFQIEAPAELAPLLGDIREIIRKGTEHGS